MHAPAVDPATKFSISLNLCNTNYEKRKKKRDIAVLYSDNINTVLYFEK
jgi:hypothetical protein